MGSTSETGHIKNLAHFEDLISYCQAYGTTYNPSNAALAIPQLQAVYTAAQTMMNNFKVQKLDLTMLSMHVVSLLKTSSPWLRALSML